MSSLKYSLSHLGSFGCTSSQNGSLLLLAAPRFGSRSVRKSDRFAWFLLRSFLMNRDLPKGWEGMSSLISVWAYPWDEDVYVWELRSFGLPPPRGP